MRYNDRQSAMLDAQMFASGLARILDQVERGCVIGEMQLVAAGRLLTRAAPVEAVADYLPWHQQVRRLRDIARRVGPLAVSLDERMVEATAEQALVGGNFDPLAGIRIEPPHVVEERRRRAVLPRYINSKEKQP